MITSKSIWLDCSNWHEGTVFLTLRNCFFFNTKHASEGKRNCHILDVCHFTSLCFNRSGFVKYTAMLGILVGTVYQFSEPLLLHNMTWISAYLLWNVFINVEIVSIETLLEKQNLIVWYMNHRMIKPIKWTVCIANAPCLISLHSAFYG